MPLNRDADFSKPKSERTTPLAVDIAKRLRDTRRARNLKKYQLERLANVSKGTVTRMENFERCMLPSVNVLFQLAQALQVDVGWLITGIVPDGKWRPPLGITRRSPGPR